jgi:nucleoside-diphosphate-sugar epimerase
VRPGRPVSSVTVPGAPGVGHQWAYLPDVAETMVRLLARERDLAPFDVFHMGGHWDPDGTVSLFRELREMRYLWQVPVRLDSRRLERLTGPEPRTPLDEAVRETLLGLGCIAPGET